MIDIENIIKRCLKGDRRSQEKLVAHFGPKLLPLCKRYTRDSHLAQDALQETFINVFRYLGNFKGSGVFDAWIRRIAVNCSLNTLKKGTFQYHSVSDDGEYMLPSVDATVYQHLDYEDILKVIEELPPIYYMVFNLYVVEGYGHKEIGTMLDIGESTSRSNLSRARKKLVEILKKKRIELGNNLAV